jgi:hypothetical protein
MGAVVAVISATVRCKRRHKQLQILKTGDCNGCCNDQLRDRNPKPPNAKPKSTSAMSVENTAIRRTRGRRSYLKKFVAQPGQTTTNDKWPAVPANENEKEEARQDEQPGRHKTKEAHGTTALRHLPRSKRAKAKHVQREVMRSQAAGVSQSENPGNARQSTVATCQPTARAARESVNAINHTGCTARPSK